MSRCPGCGTELFTMGCPNTECGMSMGGTYVNGVKVATASGRSLLAPLRTLPCGHPWASAVENENGSLRCGACGLGLHLHHVFDAIGVR